MWLGCYFSDFFIFACSSSSEGLIQRWRLVDGSRSQTTSCCIVAETETLWSLTWARSTETSSCPTSGLWVSSCRGSPHADVVLWRPVCVWSHPEKMQSHQVPGFAGPAARVVCLRSETGEQLHPPLSSVVPPPPQISHVFLFRSTSTPLWPSTLFTALRRSKNLLCCVWSFSFYVLWF